MELYKGQIDVAVGEKEKGVGWIESATGKKANAVGMIKKNVEGQIN